MWRVIYWSYIYIYIHYYSPSLRIYIIWVKSHPCAATYNGDNCLHLSSVVLYVYIQYTGRQAGIYIYTRRVYYCLCPVDFSWERSAGILYKIGYTERSLRSHYIIYLRVMYTCIGLDYCYIILMYLRNERKNHRVQYTTTAAAAAAAATWSQCTFFGV